jgi:hypothetical protein
VERSGARVAREDRRRGGDRHRRERRGQLEDATIALAQMAGADLESLDLQDLAVAGLRAGRYGLQVDGQPVGTWTAEELAKGVNLARYPTPMRWQAFSVSWSATAGHELQRLRRRLLVAAEKEPSRQAIADALAAQDEEDQKARGALAIPKPRRFDLLPVK